MYGVLYAVALECFHYMYVFLLLCIYNYICMVFGTLVLDFSVKQILKFGISGYKSSHQIFLWV